MPLNLFYTMVQKSQKWPKTQIKGGSCWCVLVSVSVPRSRISGYLRHTTTPSKCSAAERSPDLPLGDNDR